MYYVDQKNHFVFHKTVRLSADCLVSELDSNAIEYKNNQYCRITEDFYIYPFPTLIQSEYFAIRYS